MAASTRRAKGGEVHPRPCWSTTSSEGKQNRAPTSGACVAQVGVANRRWRPPDGTEEPPPGVCQRLRAAVSSVAFEATFAALVTMNAMLMAIQAQHTGLIVGRILENPGSITLADEVWPGMNVAFAALGWFFGILFTLEVLVKALALQRGFFRDAWNLLDSILVLLWIMESGHGDLLPLNPMILRLVRLIRLLRLIRLVRTIRAFDPLYVIITSLKGSISSLGWTMAFLGLITTTIALFLIQLLNPFLADDGNDPLTRRSVYRYFGTFTRAFLTMFEMMLANWPPSSRSLTENVSEWYVLFVFAFQLGMTLAVGKVITGVFLQVTFQVASLDDTIMMNQHHRAVRVYTRKMEKLFRAGDDDGNFSLDLEEFKAILKDPEVRTWLSALELNPTVMASHAESLHEMMRSGVLVSASSFVQTMTSMRGSAKSSDLALLTSEVRRLSEIVTEIQSDQQAMRGALLHRQDASWLDDHGPSISSAVGADGHPGGARVHPEIDTDYASSGSSCPLNEAQRATQSTSELVEQKRSTSVSAHLFSDSKSQQNVQGPPSLKRIVESLWFEALFSVVIMLNTVTMVLQAQYDGFELGRLMGYPGYGRAAADIWPWASSTFLVFEWFFGVAFTLELLLKVAALRLDFLKGPWNWLDTVIVVSWMLQSTGEVETVDLNFLRLTRMVRLLRALRLAKSIKGFEALYVMVTSVKGSVYALIWSACIMFLLELLLSLCIMTLVEPFILDESKPLKHRREVYRYFGTCSKAMLSMFELTMANWVPVSRTLTEYINEWYLVFVLAHKLVVGVAVVTVITGIFLQETFNVASNDDFIMMKRKELASSAFKLKMQRLFSIADKDLDGTLTKEEFHYTLRAESMQTWLAAMGVQVSAAEMLFELLDPQGHGSLTMEQLGQGITTLKGPARSIDLALMKQKSRHLALDLAQIREENRRLWKEVAEAGHQRGSGRK